MKFFTIGLSLALTVNLYAQDAEFSQFYASPVYTNPALSGVGLCGGRVVANYRNQWPSLPGTFRTFSASYDQASKKIGGAYGFIAFSDIAGDGLLTTTSFSGIYAFQTPLSRKWNMSAGIQASYVQRSIDFSKLHFADEIEPKKGFIYDTKETLPNQQVRFPNFSSGIVFYTNTFFAGFAVHNITEPYQSFYGSTGGGTKLPRRFSSHCGVDITLNKARKSEDRLVLSPNILIMVQEKFSQANFGFQLSKNKLYSGLWFRQTGGNSDALIALIGFRMESFKVAYTYDFTVSTARAAAPGSHEISVGYAFCIKKRPGVPAFNNQCPDMFK